MILGSVSLKVRSFHLLDNDYECLDVGREVGGNLNLVLNWEVGW